VNTIHPASLFIFLFSANQVYISRHNNQNKTECVTGESRKICFVYTKSDDPSAVGGQIQRVLLSSNEISNQIFPFLIVRQE